MATMPSELLNSTVSIAVVFVELAQPKHWHVAHCMAFSLINKPKLSLSTSYRS